MPFQHYSRAGRPFTDLVVRFPADPIQTLFHWHDAVLDTGSSFIILPGALVPAVPGVPAIPGEFVTVALRGCDPVGAMVSLPIRYRIALVECWPRRRYSPLTLSRHLRVMGADSDYDGRGKVSRRLQQCTVQRNNLPSNPPDPPHASDLTCTY